MIADMNFKAEQDFLNNCAAKEMIPGGVLAFVTPEEEKCIYFGNQSLYPEKVPIKEGAVFDLASVTKVVCTTTMALIGLERGVFSLGTDVRELYPECPYENMTIKHLMTHTSGMRSDDKDYKTCRGKQEMIEFFLGKELVYPTGTRVEYSDFGYILLGAILEKYLGELDKFSRQEIFLPLGMKDTCYLPEKEGLSSRCVPTEVTKDRGVICGEAHDGKAWRMGGISGNAGLFSTAEDLCRFVRMLINDGTLDDCKILSPSTVGLLRNCYTEGLNLRRTLGWIADEPSAPMGDYYSKHCCFHTGFAGTSIYVDFDRKCGIILLTNRIHPARDNKSIFEIRRIIHNLTLLDYDNSIWGK